MIKSRFLRLRVSTTHYTYSSVSLKNVGTVLDWSQESSGSDHMKNMRSYVMRSIYVSTGRGIGNPEGYRCRKRYTETLRKVEFHLIKG